MYWEHEFPTQEKVYKIDNDKKLKDTIRQIYDAGYTDSLIIQDTIPGNDEFMRVLTCFSGKDKKSKNDVSRTRSLRGTYTTRFR